MSADAVGIRHYKSSAAPKALALCIDWSRSTAGRVMVRGIYYIHPFNETYATGLGNESEIGRQALSGCYQFQAKHSCVCQLIEVNGRRAR
jgi:hypothetical protein